LSAPGRKARRLSRYLGCQKSHKFSGNGTIPSTEFSFCYKSRSRFQLS